MSRVPRFSIQAAARTCVAVAAALLTLGPTTMPAAAQEDAGALFRSDSRLVVLHATVLDKNGILVTDLPKTVFHVYENGVEQELKVFRREDAPVSLGLIIDDSGSMIDKRRRVAAAALAMVRASHPEDEVFIVHFNEKTYLDTDFTHDQARLKQGLETWDSRGTTAMRDAVRLGIEHLDRAAKEDKKVLLVVTDGEDNTSQATQEYVVKAAQQSGVLIYAVGILNETQDDRTRQARRDLDALTQATGGRAHYLNAVSEADATAREIATVIRNQYTLAYTPTDERLDGTYRKIQVIAEDPRAATVLSRNGYYAGSVASAEARTPQPSGR